MSVAMDVITPLSEWQALKEQASVLVKSGMLPPKVTTPEAAIAIMLKGKELRIPPMQAFSHIHIIDGKPCQSAENMLMLIIRDVPDARIKYLQMDDKACRIEASRRSVAKTEFAFTIDDANRAGLVKLTQKGLPSAWQKYTRALLRCRAVSEMARAMFPDAIGGCSYTPEELGAEVEMTDAGAVEVVTTETSSKTPIETPAPKKENLFVDTPKAWEWLEGLFARYYLAEDCRQPIRAIAVGKSAWELDQLAQCAASGHDEPMEVEGHN